MDGTRILTSHVWHQGVLVHADRQDLSLPVYTNDTVRLLVLCRGEDCLARNSVHVDTLTGFDIVKVDETKLGDKVDDAVFARHLHGDGEIVGGLGREEDVDGFLGERLVWRLVSDLDNVELVVSPARQLHIGR